MSFLLGTGIVWTSLGTLMLANGLTLSTTLIMRKVLSKSVLRDEVWVESGVGEVLGRYYAEQRFWNQVS